MSLVNIQPWILRAQREHFAIGAFNANTMEQVQAIALAAQAESAPALIQVSHNALRYVGDGNTLLGLQYMAAIGKIAAESVSVPISLHLDHATAQEVEQALDLGFTSVMFDGGDLPLDENISETIRLCKLAHAAGACMEGEVGEVPKADSSGYMPEAELTDPAQAAEFARATGIDNLAIALGSKHGGRNKEVQLDLERLEAIRAQVDIPLVLHGSSGVADESISAAVARGIVKVNVATQLNQAFTAAVRFVLQNPEVDPRKYLAPARLEMAARVRERIRFFSANGKA